MGSEWVKKVCPCSSIEIEDDETVIPHERTPLIIPNEPVDFGYCLLAFLLTFLFVGASIGTYLLIREVNLQSAYRSHLVLRDDWSTVEPNGPVRHIISPVKEILLLETYNTTCIDKESCEAAIRNLQKDHMRNGTDINYSFLIGGDGRIYEGLGWYMTRSSNMTVATIALLGSFSDFDPTFDQKEKLKDLLHNAIKKSLLSYCYSVFIRYDHMESFENIVNLAVELEKERKNDC